MSELVEYLMADPAADKGKPRVVKMPGQETPGDSSRFSLGTVETGESPFVANAGVARGGDMAFTTSAAQRTAAQELKKRAEKSKEKIVRRVTEKRTRELKAEDGQAFTAEYLLNAFKQSDKDMSGKLSREEVEFCFGPKFLNLGIDKVRARRALWGVARAGGGWAYSSAAARRG